MSRLTWKCDVCEQPLPPDAQQDTHPTREDCILALARTLENLTDRIEHLEDHR